MQREPDLLAAHTHSRRVVGAGYVGEPCGQRLRHPSDAPVVGDLDGDRHRPARGHRCIVEGPGGAGFSKSGHCHVRSAADRVIVRVGVPEHTREGVGPRRAGGGDRVGDGGIPLQREPDLLAAHTHSRRVVGAGYVGEPCGQRLRHPSDAPVVGDLDGDRHRPARGHRCIVEGPGGAGFSKSGHCHVRSAADRVIVRVGVPEHTREGVGPRRAGGGDRVGDGGIPLQREPDLLAAHTHSRRVVGAGYVGEPCGQRLRHPSNAPIVGDLDGDHHLATRSHRCIVEGPGGAGFSKGGHRHVRSAADRVIVRVGVPQHTREGVAPRRPGGGGRVGDGGVPLQREPDLLAVHTHSRRVVGAVYVGEPSGQRLRHPPDAPIVGDLDGDHHLATRSHRCSRRTGWRWVQSAVRLPRRCPQEVPRPPSQQQSLLSILFCPSSSSQSC